MNETTVLELAQRDHRHHLRLIEAVQAEHSLAARASGTARLAADLRRHSHAEHAALIAMLLAHETVRPVARRAVAAHQRLHRLLADLTCRAYDELALDVALSTYRASFLEYARFEEEELFPAAVLALGPERCRELAESYRAALPTPIGAPLS